MKSKMGLIVLCFLISCASSDVQLGSSSYKKIHWIMEHIIQKGNNIDSLLLLIKDPDINLTRESSGFTEKMLMRKMKELSEHIRENNFDNGYIIEKESSNSISFHEKHFMLYSIKVRSIKTKDIIWFTFSNEENGIWKFATFSFCNNPQGIDYEMPCDKD